MCRVYRGSHLCEGFYDRDRDRVISSGNKRCLVFSEQAADATAVVFCACLPRFLRDQIAQISDRGLQVDAGFGRGVEASPIIRAANGFRSIGATDPIRRLRVIGNPNEDKTGLGRGIVSETSREWDRLFGSVHLRLSL